MLPGGIFSILFLFLYSGKTIESFSVITIAERDTIYMWLNCEENKYEAKKQEKCPNCNLIGILL